MEYMEQQMQNYIEAGLSEADRCYARIAELEKLNQELQAQVEALRGVLQCFHPENFEYLPNSFDLGDDVIEALAATPQQHLAEIRAQAGRAGFLEGLKKARKMYGCELGYCKTDADEAANQYAEYIRQEKK